MLLKYAVVKVMPNGHAATIGNVETKKEAQQMMQNDFESSDRGLSYLLIERNKRWIVSGTGEIPQVPPQPKPLVTFNF